MKGSKLLGYVLFGLLTFNLTGCLSFSVGVEKNPPEIKSTGIVSTHLALDDIRPFNGKLIEGGVLSGGQRWGNLVSLDIWPVGGLGLGLLGVRMKLLFLEAGVGFFGYDAQPRDFPIRGRKTEAPEAKKPEKKSHPKSDNGAETNDN